MLLSAELKAEEVYSADIVPTYILCEMLCGHIADIYLQGYMSALYPSSGFTSG